VTKSQKKKSARLKQTLKLFKISNVNIRQIDMSAIALIFANVLCTILIGATAAGLALTLALMTLGLICMAVIMTRGCGQKHSGRKDQDQKLI
jgi:hypothetical protein